MAYCGLIPDCTEYISTYLHHFEKKWLTQSILGEFPFSRKLCSFKRTGHFSNSMYWFYYSKHNRSQLVVTCAICIVFSQINSGKSALPAAFRRSLHQAFFRGKGMIHACRETSHDSLKTELCRSWVNILYNKESSPFLLFRFIWLINSLVLFCFFVIGYILPCYTVTEYLLGGTIGKIESSHVGWLTSWSVLFVPKIAKKTFLHGSCWRITSQTKCTSGTCNIKMTWTSRIKACHNKGNDRNLGC